MTDITKQLEIILREWHVDESGLEQWYGQLKGDLEALIASVANEARIEEIQRLIDSAGEYSSTDSLLDLSGHLAQLNRPKGE